MSMQGGRGVEVDWRLQVCYPSIEPGGVLHGETVQAGLGHVENGYEDNKTNFVDQDEKDNRNVSLVPFPTRYEVVVVPIRAQLLCDLNRDGDMCGVNAEVVRHSAEQGQQAAVKVDIPNRHQGCGVLWVKLILKLDEHDYNKDQNDGNEHHFLDHPMVPVGVLRICLQIPCSTAVAYANVRFAGPSHIFEWADSKSRTPLCVC